jgi:hypothetical protein
MTLRTAMGIGAILIVSAGVGLSVADEWKSGIVWPEPKVVEPGTNGSPPSDAIVLFDGADLSKWHGGEDWIVKDGYC